MYLFIYFREKKKKKENSDGQSITEEQKSASHLDILTQAKKSVQDINPTA